MKIDMNSCARRVAFLAGLMLAASPALAQAPERAPAGASYAAPAADSAPENGPATERPRSRRSRTTIAPYLEVAQVVSADLDGGDTLTYTSIAAGIDGRIETRRVTVQASYRYQRNIEWEGQVGDEDIHSGIAVLRAAIIPNQVQFEAGALATRTAGDGRALGVTDRDGSAEIYSAYAGPSLSTHAGPVAVNASYRLGYVKIDDDLTGAGIAQDLDEVTVHNAQASVGMSPGRLPVGWTVGAGYVRSDTDSDYDDRLEAAYVRADLVVPVGPTLALTAGVGYEDIEASQQDLARDGNGNLIFGPDGLPVADPTRPRLLTYDLDGIIYDAGLIWRPSVRTELQLRAGHRYGGTTFVGTFRHQIGPSAGLSAVLFDTVETFGSLLTSDISSLPDEFDVVTDPVTGQLGGCTFGSDPGSGACFTRALQSIRGGTFRLRGGGLILSGESGLWDWGLGAGYAHRRYGRTGDPVLDLLGPSEDESATLYASLGRRLSRTSDVSLDAYASWFNTDEANVDEIFTAGTTATYSRHFLMERLRLIAALGLHHSDDGALNSQVASGLLGLRYTF